MTYLLSSPILFEVFGPFREPVRSWMDTQINPKNARICSISVHWILGTINSPDVSASRRAGYSANIPLWVDEFRRDGGQECQIDESVLTTWHQIYQTAREQNVFAEEAFVLATAISKNFEYISFYEDWLNTFAEEFGLRYKSFDKFDE